jgi:preprotein translocase subunit SecY
MILNILLSFNVAIAGTIQNKIMAFMNDQVLYAAVYFLLVFIFTFFYTAVTFDPDAMSKNLQRTGAFIPGVRPGTHTSAYIGKLITRLTFAGGIFLGIIAVLPMVMQIITNVQTLALGGTALLIAVSVVIDLVRRLDSQVSLRQY